MEKLERLVNQYPILFRSFRDQENYPCVFASYGFQCGDGWYDILDLACEKVERELEAVIAGFDILKNLSWLDRRLQRIEFEIIEDGIFTGVSEPDPEPLLPFVSQIKEKFGRLCLHIRPGIAVPLDGLSWKRIREYVNTAEIESGATCETCGADGILRQDGWHRVTCPKCEGKYRKRKSEADHA